MEQFIIWLEENIMLTMVAIAVVLILITLIVAIVKGKKKNKSFAKELAIKEGEQVASEVFAEKEEECKIEEEVSVIEEVAVEDEIAPVVEVEPVQEETREEIKEEKVEEVVVKAKAKTTKPAKKESTFSPRKKSVTVIDPEYVTAKKEEKVEKIKVKESKEEKVEVAPIEEVKTETTTKSSGGKWEIHKTGSSFYYLLRASNGEVLATSEAYSTEEGARSGINTLKRNIEGGTVRIEEDKNDNYCFKLTSRPPFPRLLCVGQSYKYKKSAEGSFESVKRLATLDIPVVSMVEEDSDHIEEIVVDVASVAPSALPGKWEIVEKDGKFGVILRASNGVLVLNGEPRATQEGCLDYIEKIKKNLKSGSVKVQEDKNGQFCYKLYSAQKRIVCVGEKYSTMQSAISSAESLARFAENATINDLTAKKED